MTYAPSQTTQDALKTFQNFDTDAQLALLWYGYLDLKENLQPHGSRSAEVPAQALVDQIQAFDQQKQLEVQREIINRADSPVSKSYASLSSSGKLEVWLLLAQGMERGDIINVPESYELPAGTHDFAQQIKQLDFEQRINFMRSAAVEMGAR